MSRGLALKGVCQKLWNFNTLPLLQQPDSPPFKLFQKDTDPALLQRSILIPVAEWTHLPLLWMKRFVSLQQNSERGCEKTLLSELTHLRMEAFCDSSMCESKFPNSEIS
jgi:hypothetical protein